LRTASQLIGSFFIRLRDLVARGLVAAGVTPNVLTVAGLLITCGAAVALSLGQWLTAGLVLVAAGACDMLDGAAARLGQKRTPFGGVLDSTCDRVGDIVLLGSLAYYFLVRWPALAGKPANLTYGLLALLAIINSTLISYVRARARQEGADCEVGFWTRGERYVAIVIGAFARNPAMILWQLGMWSGLTALYRLAYARRALRGATRPNAERNVLSRIVFFDEPRGSLAYDLNTGLAIALLVFARVPETDLVRRLIEHIGGG
jgi:CDP-diacylglycerol--glycerol-3-phosphate 3-phosphatidyltransferase